MKRFKRVSSGFTAAVLGLSSLMTMGFTGVAHASANVCQWTGSTGNSMNTAANWNNCGGVVPQSGDSIEFKQISTSASATHGLINNLSTAVQLAGIVVDQTQTVANVTDLYTFSGNMVNLAVGGTISVIGTLSGTSGAKLSFYNSLGLHAYGDLAITSAVVPIMDSTWTNLGQIDGNLIIGNGVYLGNFYGYSGTVTGQVQVAANSQLKIDPNNAVFGSVVAASNAQISFFGAGNATGNTDYAHETVTFPITLNGATLYVRPSSTYTTSFATIPATNYTFSGGVTLGADSSIGADGTVTANFTGTFNKNGHVLTIAPNTNGVGVVQLNGQTFQNAPKTTLLSDSLPNCTQGDNSGCYYVINNETATLDGARGYVDVEAGGTLKGTGTAGSALVENTGIIAPGHSPGKLTILTQLLLAGGSIYQAQLQTKTNYDQLQVGTATDTDATNPDVYLGDFTGTTQTKAPILQTSLYDGYKIAKGDTFTIINNLSKTDVKGTFASLPEGATFKVDSAVFSITYKGGDGNDVVLTAITAPTTPDTGFAVIASHPGLTLGFTVVAATAIMIMAKRMRPTPVAVRVRSKSSRRRK